MRSFLLTTALLAALAAPAAAQEPAAAETARIMRLLRQTPLIDGHNDLPYAIREAFASDLDRIDITANTKAATPALHTDLPRLRAGGVGAQFWSVYVSAELKGLDSHRAVTQQIDLVRRMVARYPQYLELAVTADDVVRIHRAGRVASLMGIEGGEAIAGDLALLRAFRAAGVGYMTLCHAKTTDWVDSATDAPKHGGLAPFGEQVVREMNRIGMLVDLSHVSADAMRDAIAVSSAPVIFSHSSAFALDPHPRNVPDDVLRMLPQNGGVVMVNFYSGFVSEEFWRWASGRGGAQETWKRMHPAATPDEIKAALAAWTAENPPPPVPLSVVADHIEHIRNIAGVDHVGLGADYDGVDYLPEGLDGVEDYPALLAELARRGWSNTDLRKLAGENVLRVMRAAERVAAQNPVIPAP